MTKLLLPILLLISFNGYTDTKPKQVIVDMKKHVFTLSPIDSIWWQQGEFIVDRVDTLKGWHLRRGHEAPLETQIGLKNFKPVVVIIDGDTSRYWWNDTVRISRERVEFYTGSILMDTSAIMTKGSMQFTGNKKFRITKRKRVIGLGDAKVGVSGGQGGFLDSFLIENKAGGGVRLTATLDSFSTLPSGLSYGIQLDTIPATFLMTECDDCAAIPVKGYMIGAKFVNETYHPFGEEVIVWGWKMRNAVWENRKVKNVVPKDSISKVYYRYLKLDNTGNVVADTIKPL